MAGGLPFRAILVGLIFIALTVAARSAEIKVMSSVGIRGPLNELKSLFERDSTDRLTVIFGTAAELKKAIEAHPASFDVAILTPSAISELVSSGAIEASSVKTLAKAGVGLAVRAGAPKPDLSDESAFWRALVRANGVAYASDGASGIYFRKLLRRQGIDAAALRLVGVAGGSPLDQVTNGQADLGVQLIPEIKANKGVELAGEFPHSFQHYTTMTAGVGIHSSVKAESEKLVSFLRSRGAQIRMLDYGFSPAD